MLRARGTLILAAAAVIALGAAYYGRQSMQPTGVADSGAFVPGLMTRVNDVAGIVITSGGETATLRKRDTGWVVVEKHNYPADLSEVRALVLGLAELRRIEPKTANPERYAEIGLADATESAAGPILVRLQDGAGGDLAAVAVGKQRPGAAEGNRSQYYVRTPDDPRAWLTEGRLPSARAASDWIDSQILDIEDKRIRAVTVVHADQAMLRVAKQSDTDDNYSLQGLAEGEEVESVYAVNSIARSARALTAKDVARSDALAAADRPVRVTVETFDGLNVELSFDKHEDEVHVRLQASAAEDGTTGSGLDAEVGKLNERWRDWVYTVPAYQFDSLVTKREDLIKKPPAPEPSQSGG